MPLTPHACRPGPAPQGLRWNAAQAAPWRVAPLDPDFEDYLTRGFAFAPSQGLAGLVAALHACRAVTAYGFGLSAQHGGWGTQVISICGVAARVLFEAGLQIIRSVGLGGTGHG